MTGSRWRPPKCRDRPCWRNRPSPARGRSGRQGCGMTRAGKPFRRGNRAAPSIGTVFASRKQSRRGAAMASVPKPALELLIAAPRGFCAGVDRAVRIVELAIEKYGPPGYVRHEIVHNRFVVDAPKA